MNNTIEELIAYFKFQNKLKTVLRNNWTPDGRKESSAEHSWSVAMMAWLLTANIENELNIRLNQDKIIKMALIHDIVEIKAGDVAAWDKKGREVIKIKERNAIEDIFSNLPEPKGREIYELWIEHDRLQTIESKLVKACDQMCPLIYRIVYKNTYEGTGMTRKKLDDIFMKIVEFSKTTLNIYLNLATELEKEKIL